MSAKQTLPLGRARSIRWRTVGTICATALTLACAQRIPLPPSPPARPALAEVAVDVGRAWTDSGVAVRKGDRLVFWATGDVKVRSRPEQTTGPDGMGAWAHRVGKGGLVGRVGEGKPFDIGARTHLIWRGAGRAQRLVAPPPIEMKRDGVLRLGIRDWRPGRYDGTFLVSIWQASHDGLVSIK